MLDTHLSDKSLGVNLADDQVSATQVITLPEDARILVVKLASLGDLLLMTPALRALRRRYPRARLDALTTRQAAPLLRDSPLVDHVYTLGMAGDDGRRASGGAWLRTGWASLATLATLGRLRATRYDAVALLHHLTLPAGRVKHRALLAAIGAHWRAGLDNGHGGFLNMLNVRVADQGFGIRHEVEYFLAVAEALGAASTLAWPMACAFPSPLTGRGWRRRRSDTSETSLAAEGASSGAPLVAIHPGAGRYSLARRWPVTRFAGVMRTLHEETGALFVVVGGAEEMALRLRLLRALGYPQWAASMDDVADAVSGLGAETIGADGRLTDAASSSGDDLRLLADILRRCDLFIGDDSFPMHMAAAVGTPVVAIFGPTNHRAWRPYVATGADETNTEEHAIIVRRDDLVCSPCLYRGHTLGLRNGCAPRPCLTELGTAPVIAAARRLLAGRSKE